MVISRAPRSGALRRAAVLPIAGVAVATVLAGCGGSSDSATSSGPSTSASAAPSAKAAAVDADVPHPPFAGRAYADAASAKALDDGARKRPLSCELIAAGEREALVGKALPRLQASTATNESDCTFTTDAAGFDDPQVIVVVRPAMDAAADVYAHLTEVASDSTTPADVKARLTPLASELSTGALTSPKTCSVVQRVLADPSSKGATALVLDKGGESRRLACAGLYAVSVKTTPAAKDGLDATFAQVVSRFTKDVLPTAATPR